MKIIEPKVELIPFNGNCIEHVAKCARVCYGKESGNDKHLYNALKNNKHWSMFRHETHYYVVGRTAINSFLHDIYDVSVNNHCVIVGIDIYLYKNYYIVCNGNFLLDNPNIKEYLEPFEVTPSDFLAMFPEAKEMMRYTFKVTTQISTSRELNRVSPNNIAERSTRYVYEDGTICKPHWMSDEEVEIINKCNSNTETLVYNDRINSKIFRYISSCKSSFNNYKDLIDIEYMPREDARGVLPFDTATKVIYTYSINEWRDIIDLRYYGTTGKPHPNAYIIAEMIKKELEKLGYNFREK